MRFEKLSEWLTWQESFHPRAIDLGLSRVRKVFHALAHDYRQPFTITVAGTNGKGSCIAFLASILRSQGYTVGAYTSPHLLRYNERIQIDGESVTDRCICEAFSRVDAARKNVSLTYFEFGTLAALDIFARSKIDIQLLEVGLGGRLDAVNIVDANAALITCIEIDHVDWLGESREAIGLEKAGVLRSHVAAVLGEKTPPKSLLQYATDNHVPVSRFQQDFYYERHTDAWNWVCKTHRYQNLPFPALQGEHQFQNASAVLQVLSLVSEECPVSESAIRQGLGSVSLSGRYQYLRGKPSVLLDVAHNPQSAASLATYVAERHKNRSIHAIFSIMTDKDIYGVVNNMKSVVSHWYVATLDISRCAEEGEIIEVFDESGVQSYSTGFVNSYAAFKEAEKQGNDESIILVFGSFFLVAEFLRYKERCIGMDELAEFTAYQVDYGNS